MNGIQVEIRSTSFDPWQELMRWGGDPAAVAVFVGRVRPIASDGHVLQALELEHYPGSVSYTHLTLPTKRIV